MITNGDLFDISDLNDRKLLIDYINFCAEEYLWFKKGRIPDDVWKSWRSGMLYFFNLKPINKIVHSQLNQKDSYYGLFNEIKNELLESY